MSLENLKTWMKNNIQGSILENEPMEKHTSFRIGGPADVLVLPKNTEDIKALLVKAKEENVPVTVIGNGSNLLVLDKGVRGVVVQIGNALKEMAVSGNALIAEAGISLAMVSNQAFKHGLTGMEFAVGIPGSLGGAVFMNAGAYDGEMKNVVSSVEVLTSTGDIVNIPKEKLDFSYRHSALQTMDCVILKITMELNHGDKAAIEEKMNDFTTRRTTKQPLDMPNAGSMFKRPKGYFAGTLIQENGLKGYSVGGAQVSTKHAGFVVNTGNATAKDVLTLIQDVQKKVFAATGVKLEPEVKIIGEE